MTSTPPPYWTPPQRWGAGRVIAVVVAVLLLLPGLGLLLGGGVLLWADLGGRTDGYVFSQTDDFSTEGYALSSERIDLATGADWVPLSAALGTARAEVTAADPGTAIFVGVAPVAEGSAYLAGVQHSVINDLGTGATDEVPVAGGAPATPPGEQDFWAAQVSGTGTQRLDWEPAQGDWLFVVMNADGSAGVAMDARIGATVPALTGIAWGVLGAGLFLLLVGVLVLVLAVRRPRVAAVYAPSPSAPPWSPPAPVDRTTAADARTEERSEQRPPTG